MSNHDITAKPRRRLTKLKLLTILSFAGLAFQVLHGSPPFYIIACFVLTAMISQSYFDLLNQTERQAPAAFDRDALFAAMRELGYTTRNQTDELIELFEQHVAAHGCVFHAVPVIPSDTLGPQHALCVTCGQPPSITMRPQAVPMTEFQRGSLVIEHLGPEALAGGQMSALDVFNLGITATEAHHGITAQGGEG